MNRLLMMGTMIVAMGSLGWAVETPAAAHEGPCKKILEACQAAGYYKGGHKKGPNKGEYIDCLDPIIKGGSVAGVSVTPDEVSACSAHMAKRQARKAAGGASAPAAAPAAPAAH